MLQDMVPYTFGDNISASWKVAVKPRKSLSTFDTKAYTPKISSSY